MAEKYGNVLQLGEVRDLEAPNCQANTNV